MIIRNEGSGIHKKTGVNEYASRRINKKQWKKLGLLEVAAVLFLKCEGSFQEPHLKMGWGGQNIPNGGEKRNDKEVCNLI